MGNRAGWIGDVLGLVGTCKYIGEEENSILERYTNFVYIEPKSSNDYMITSIWSFVSERYPKNTTLLYPSDSLLSKRFWESPMLKPFRIMFDEWDDFCDCFPNEIYESKYHRYAYTAPSRDMYASAITRGVHQDGDFYSDFGTLLIGSFGIEINFVIDCQNCMKSINLFVYNSWSVASATRHPVTRKPLIEKEYVHTLNTIFHIKKASKIKNCQPK